MTPHDFIYNKDCNVYECCNCGMIKDVKNPVKTCEEWIEEVAQND